MAVVGVKNVPTAYQNEIPKSLAKAYFTFLTQTEYQGDKVNNPGNCEDATVGTNMDGKGPFGLVISVDGRAPKARFSGFKGRLYNSLGELIYDDVQNFFVGSDNYGTRPLGADLFWADGMRPLSEIIWTGLKANGDYYENNNCQNWTSTNTDFGATGFRADLSDTSSWLYGFDFYCSSWYHVLCISQ